MPWVKIDEQFPEHPKVAKAGPLALAMQVAALCYCNRKMTDGFIPRGIARTLLDWEVVRSDGTVYTLGLTSGMSGQDVTSAWVIDLLVEVGIWDEVEGGYAIHDYLEYQPSRAEIEAKRAQTAAAGRKGGQSRRRPPSETLSEPPSEPLSEPEASRLAERQAERQAKSKPDPVPEDISLSGLNHQSTRAREERPHGRRDGEIDLKPQVRPIAGRWLQLFPHQRQQAADVLNVLVPGVDVGFVDEGIGHCVQMAQPPGTPQYLFALLVDWAGQRGAPETAREIAELSQRVKAKANRS